MQDRAGEGGGQRGSSGPRGGLEVGEAEDGEERAPGEGKMKVKLEKTGDHEHS